MQRGDAEQGRHHLDARRRAEPWQEGEVVTRGAVAFQLERARRYKCEGNTFVTQAAGGKVEHVLGEKMVARLESKLQTYRSAGSLVPESPHPIRPGD